MRLDITIDEASVMNIALAVLATRNPLIGPYRIPPATHDTQYYTLYKRHHELVILLTDEFHDASMINRHARKYEGCAITCSLRCCREKVPSALMAAKEKFTGIEIGDIGFNLLIFALERGTHS